MKRLLVLFFYLYELFIVHSEILNVVELNRHGARTPNSFPEESSKLFFGSTDMQLTINGYRQHQILGQLVRDKYIKTNHFLKKSYDSKEFEVISTPTQRTIFSAAGFLSGVYPDSLVKMKYQEANGMIVNDTPPNPIDNGFINGEIPIKVIDPRKDSLLHSIKCKYNGKKLENYLVDVKNNTEIFKITAEEKETAIEELKKFLKFDSTTFNPNMPDEALEELTKFFYPYLYHFNKANISPLTKDTMLTVKKYMLNRWYSPRIKNSKYLRLAVSEFFQKIVDNFENTIESIDNKQPHNKYLLLSGHDTNIVNILSNLLDNDYLVDIIKKALNDEQLFNFVVPPFATNIFFELHYEEDYEDYFVNIIYNGKPLFTGLKEITKKDLTKEKNYIKYQRFVDFMNNLIEKDHVKLDCSQNDTENRIRNKMKKMRELMW